MTDMVLTLNPINGYSLINPEYSASTYDGNIVIAKGKFDIRQSEIYLGDLKLGTIKKDGNVDLDAKAVMCNLGYVTGLCNQILYFNSVMRLH
ncbi:MULTISPECIES: hypothetical protein [Proteus]|uniref:hypothetical protein n=1 Tax=Proteus TaxID=583 RepID=UPI0015F1F571|nr:hypothetical protein [Proteus columbae]QMP24127.1 hypothetical protein [Proteus phage 10]